MVLWPKVLALAGLLAGFLELANAQDFYPSGHFDRVSKLSSPEDLATQLSSSSSKTTFAPGWNDVTRLFADNDDVAFGDVNLQQAPGFRGEPHNPGQGGWPTIRYFNQETGPDGGSYTKLTNKPMCEELGDRMRMIDYVESYGKTVLCDLDGTNCNEKELAYLEKYKNKDKAELKSQLQRVEDMLTKPMNDNLRLWAYRRMRIVNKLLAAGVFQSPDL